MKKYKVTLEVDVVGDATSGEVKNVLCFKLGALAFCRMPNPFFAEDSDCDYSVKNFDIVEL